MDKKIIITHGLPGSGKSTWAKQFKTGNHVIIERDIVREQLFGKDYYMPEHYKEQQVTDMTYSLMKQAWNDGYDVICSDTNLNVRFLKKLVKFANDNNVKIIQKHFNVPVEICLERNKQRDRKVPEDVILKMAKRSYDILGNLHTFYIDSNNVWSIPKHTKYSLALNEYCKTIEKPNSNQLILVDVDGTLAENEDLAKECFQSGNKDYDRFYREIEFAKVNKELVKNVNQLQKETNAQVWILSGRSEAYYKELIKFLERSKLNFHNIILKTEKDFRKGHKFKETFLDTIEQYQIIEWFDDDEKVLELFRGLK